MDFAVSGDAIRLAGNAFLVRALQALGELPSSLPDHAIIGGLAVMVRLQQAHRVTGDIDLVSADESRTIQLLVDGDATRTRNGVRLPSGIDLDLIDASDPGVTPGIATDEIERRAIEGQLAFSHALRSATLVDISVSTPDLRPASAEVRVATTGDLVALKLHAALDPRRDATKRSSDLYDLARILLVHGTKVIGNELTDAPPALRDSVLRETRDVLIDGADRSAATLRRDARACAASRSSPLISWSFSDGPSSAR
jgi:hypothetical protein